MVSRRIVISLVGHLGYLIKIYLFPNKNGNIYIRKCLLGSCYCKDKQGKPNSNEIMCATDTKLEQLDRCQDDESCIGPNSSVEAKLFSKRNFCSKGALKHFTINLFNFRF